MQPSQVRTNRPAGDIQQRHTRDLIGRTKRLSTHRRISKIASHNQGHDRPIPSTVSYIPGKAYALGSRFHSIDNGRVAADEGSPSKIPFIVRRVERYIQRQASLTSKNSSSTATRKSIRQDPASSKRARHHLKRHSEEFDRAFSVFPKTLSLEESKELFTSSYGDSNKGNALTKWLLEPLEELETIAGLEKIQESVIGFPVAHVMSKGGILFGTREGTEVKSALVFQEYDEENPVRNGIIKRYIDVFHTCSYLHVRSHPAGMPQLQSCRTQRDQLSSFISRAQDLEDKLAEWHSNYGPRQVHWYLSDIAVLPNCQNAGYGSQMMRALTQLADRYQVPIYLEAVGSEGFFHRFGFRTLRCGRITNGSTLEVTLLQREPLP